MLFCKLGDPRFSLVTDLFTVLEIKKSPGCLYFKSRATKPVNLVALMNPWLPVRKAYTYKCTTQKNIHFCLLGALNYMLNLPLLSAAQNKRGSNCTGTLLLVY